MSITYSHLQEETLSIKERLKKKMLQQIKRTFKVICKTFTVSP